MWEVVGLRQRVSKDKVYYDICLSREFKSPGQGLEVRSGSYSAEQIAYIPRIGDRIVVELGNYQGREYIKDIEVM